MEGDSGGEFAEAGCGAEGVQDGVDGSEQDEVGAVLDGRVEGVGRQNLELRIWNLE